jgi:hypothetical protein
LAGGANQTLGIKKRISGKPHPAASLSAILPRESRNPLFNSQGLLITFASLARE